MKSCTLTPTPSLPLFFVAGRPTFDPKKASRVVFWDRASRFFRFGLLLDGDSATVIHLRRGSGRLPTPVWCRQEGRAVRRSKNQCDKPTARTRRHAPEFGTDGGGGGSGVDAGGASTMTQSPLPLSVSDSVCSASTTPRLRFSPRGPPGTSNDTSVSFGMPRLDPVDATADPSSFLRSIAKNSVMV